MNRKHRIDEIKISTSTSIEEALKLMDNVNARLLLVVDDKKFVSLLSIGDIQRAIISNHNIKESIKNILRSNVVVARSGDDIDKIKSRMLQDRTEFMPIVNEKTELINIIFWQDIFKKKERIEKKINLPVVIMAGGKGTRMRPITNVLPKPLIPIDNKTIIEHIIENFIKIGCKSFYVSINYKAKMIRDYFADIDKNYFIHFFEEENPLGTAGSLHLLNGQIHTSFFISNCDILINEDYNEIYKYHKDYKNEPTIVSSFL